MPDGFFTASTLAQSKAPISTVAKCGACGLLSGCHSPKMKPTGQGRMKVLIVAEAPGKTEDERGEQLIGEAGQLLRKILRTIGRGLDVDTVKTNSIICRPPNNRTPTDQELEYCRPYLTKTIDRFQPNVIIPLGGPAINSVLMGIWKEDVGAVERWAGRTIPEQRTNTWICPSWHPSYLLRTKDQVLERQLTDHLDSAFKLAESRPWAEVPDFKRQVKIIIDTNEAAHIIRKMCEAGGHISFDYETNTLRPENGHAAIISCSICWRGMRTIAFPWAGPAREATRDLLWSDCPKIGYNIKFEDRWTRKEFGEGVKNWVLCGQTAVHCESSVPGTKALEYQAFVRYGLPPYDKHIKPFLKSKGSSPLNQILTHIDLRDLLLYNGLDSLVEYKIGYDIAKEYDYATIPKYV